MMPTFTTEVHRTARKQHKCTECHATIEPGEVYEYVSGLWDGDLNVFKTCIHCETARNFYVGDCDSKSLRDWDEGEFCFGQVCQDLIDFAGECPSGTGLKFGAYRHAVGIMKRRKAACTGGAA